MPATAGAVGRGGIPQASPPCAPGPAYNIYGYEGPKGLPPLRPWAGRGPRQPNVSEAVSDPLPLECTASECEPLQLVLVEGEAESRRWRQTLQRYHYLGCTVPFRANLQQSCLS